KLEPHIAAEGGLGFSAHWQLAQPERKDEVISSRVAVFMGSFGGACAQLHESARGIGSPGRKGGSKREHGFFNRRSRRKRSARPPRPLRRQQIVVTVRCRCRGRLHLSIAVSINDSPDEKLLVQAIKAGGGSKRDED